MYFVYSSLSRSDIFSIKGILKSLSTLSVSTGSGQYVQQPWKRISTGFPALGK